MLLTRTMQVLVVACAALLLSSICADARVMEDGFLHKEAPANWHLSSKLTDSAWKESETIRLTFAVRQRNVAKLQDLLETQLANPAHEKYQEWLTHAEVNAFIAPLPADVIAVQRFIEAHGLTEMEQSPSGDFVRVEATVATAEAMLGCTYQRFYSKSYAQAVADQKPQMVIRTLGAYSLPEHIADIVDFVQPTNHFPSATSSLKVDPAPRVNASDVYEGATPTTLRAMYSLGDIEGSDNPKNRQAVTAFLKQYFDNDDLQDFYTKEYPPAVGRTFYNVIGPNEAKPGLEAMLDVEYLTSIGANIPSEFWSFPNDPRGDIFLDFMYLLANTTDVPWVFSTSYGEEEYYVSTQLADRLNAEFSKAGARGISLLFSSGDDGVGCTANNLFSPKWPGTSRYVTSVGGTNTKTGTLGSEFAWSGSSGGFSNMFPIPDWQKDAVQAFFDNNDQLPDSDLYNATGRGFPDISALGANFNIIVNGRQLQVDGTSCSSPTVAGIIALLNELASKPLGFLNPLLYSDTSPFFDVVEGNNPNCGTNGFYATTGWDPVTGLGSINYESFKKGINLRA